MDQIGIDIQKEVNTQHDQTDLPINAITDTHPPTLIPILTLY